jgi:cyclopropane-fatty-acyl-phospholipid synthase
MLGRLLRPGPRTAADILRRVFGDVPASFAFRLWDGSEVRFGTDRPVCVAVIKSPEIFVALMRDPSPGHFAEAYVSGAVDLEGDLYKTMQVANAIEGLRLSTGQRLGIAAKMLRGRV